MTETRDRGPGATVSRLVQGIGGLLLLATGSAAITGMLIALFGDDEGYARILLHLGLALTTIGSAAAQIFVLTGAWLLWRALRRS